MECVNCRFFIHEDDGAHLDEGTCRRYPPTIVYDPDSGWAHTVWPHVDWMDWCGEFVRRPVADRRRDESIQPG